MSEHAQPHWPADALLVRIEEIAGMLRCSKRTIERLISAGRFPRPAVSLAKRRLWKRETVERWVNAQADPLTEV